MIEYAEWVVGGILVLIYGHGRFHTPKTVIGSTTRFRYYLAAALYLAAQLLLFVSLAALVSGSPGVLGGVLHIDVGGLKDKVGPVSTQIMAALLMTALLPNFPMLSKLDAWLLKRFQDLGRIPREIRLWRDRLAASDLNIPPDAAQALRKKLAEDPSYVVLKPEDLRLKADDSPQYLFSRLMYLMDVIENFSIAQGKYPRVLEDFQDEYIAVRQDFKQAVVRATRYFNAMTGHDDAASATPPVIELKRSFRDQCGNSYREMCQLLARGILMSEPTQRARRKKLESLGFLGVEETKVRLDINQVLTVFSVVFLILFAGIALTKGPGGSHAILIAVMVATIYGTAVICALAPKLAWPFANPGERGDRPVAAYLLSGLLGVGFAIVVSVVFKSFMLAGGLIDALRDTRQSYPWYVLTFCVAVFLAMFADNWGGRSTTEPRWGRYAEGIALAVLLAIAFMVVRAMFEHIPGIAPERVPDIRQIAIMAVIGLFLGALVPHWYRGMRTRAEFMPGVPGGLPGPQLIPNPAS